MKKITIQITLFLLAYIIASLLYSCKFKNQHLKKEKPNIIILLADDQGYGDLGITGNPIIETPNIDALAAASATMNNFYVSPVCAPTRASLMTGRYNYRTGVTDTYVSLAMMRTEEVTIAEVLKEAGYATGIFGKWHLGDNYPMRPMDQGFDESLILNGGGLSQPSDPFENRGRYTNPILFLNGKQIQTKGFCTDVYYNYATDFIKESVKKKKPFFAYIATNAPHGPFNDVPNDLKEYYIKKELASISLEKNPDINKLAAICAMITNIDQNVGSLVKTLKELDIINNTIIIYMSDNGPNSRRYVGAMRGRKGDIIEGGIRTMFYMYWPSVFKGGESSKVRVAHYDLMPTLLDAANITIPNDLKLDGRSFLPLLKNEKVEWKERNLFIQWHRGNAPQSYKHFAMVGQKWKLLSSDSAVFELYNINKDPLESQNQATLHSQIVDEMKTEYLKWFNSIAFTNDNNYMKPRIIIGNDAETETVLTRQEWVRESGKWWGNKGHWLLTVEQPATFNITIKIAEAKPGWNVKLNIAGIEKFGKMKDTKITFENIHLNKGDITLVSSITKDDKIYEKVHVLVKRISVDN